MKNRQVNGQMNKLVLFDIDGTLVDVFQHHLKAYSNMAKEVYGVDAEFDLKKCSGYSAEHNIVSVLSRVGVSEKVILDNIRPAIQSIKSCLEKEFTYGIENTVISGVVDILRNLNKEKVPIGIVTGNPKVIGELIINKSGLQKYFDTGAFGDEVENRSERFQIVALAIKRAESRFHKTFGDIFVVGDSPADIMSTKPLNVNSIAVATGMHSAMELRKYKPDYLFKDFSDYGKVMDVIL